MMSMSASWRFSFLPPDSPVTMIRKDVEKLYTGTVVPCIHGDMEIQLLLS